MWRPFLAEIAIAAALVTLVTLVTAGMGGGATPRLATDAGADDRTCWDARLEAEPHAQGRGHGQLCLGERTVLVAIDAEDLTPGDLYEGWLVYVDAPVTCTATPCPLPQLLGGHPASIFIRLGVATAGDTRRAHFADTFRGLTLTRGSEVQVLLLDQGPAKVGTGHIYQYLGTSWPPNSDDEGTGRIAARTHFTIR